MTALSADQRESASPETGNALLRLCHRIDLTASLGQVRAPTLVVHREHDRAAPLEQTQLMARAFRAPTWRCCPGAPTCPTLATLIASSSGAVSCLPLWT